MVWLAGLSGLATGIGARSLNRTSEPRPPLSRLIGARRRLANDQFRLNRNLLGLVLAVFDSLKKSLRGDLPHARQRLAHRGEAGCVIGGALDVVEADHRYVLRHAQSRFLERPDRAQR